jgi:ParB-like nuclease domain
VTEAAALVISNMDIGDQTFASDVGTWNVTRALRDCLAGKHRVYLFDVAEVIPYNETVEVETAKVDAMVADPDRLGAAPPLIFAMEAGKLWLIDGHHRLRALARLGAKEFAAFVIEEADTKPYRVYFNGKRVAPWMTSTQ